MPIINSWLSAASVIKPHGRLMARGPKEKAGGFRRPESRMDLLQPYFVVVAWARVIASA